MTETWKTYLLGKRNRLNFLLTLSVLIIVLIILPNFLHFVENRSGFDFRDPVLSLFKPCLFCFYQCRKEYLSTFF